MYVHSFCLKYICDALDSSNWTIAADVCLCHSHRKLNEVIAMADANDEYQRYLNIDFKGRHAINFNIFC